MRTVWSVEIDYLYMYTLSVHVHIICTCTHYLCMYTLSVHVHIICTCTHLCMYTGSIYLDPAKMAAILHLFKTLFFFCEWLNAVRLIE